jgi:hypothetical protein
MLESKNAANIQFFEIGVEKNEGKTRDGSCRDAINRAFTGAKTTF